MKKPLTQKKTTVQEISKAVELLNNAPVPDIKYLVTEIGIINLDKPTKKQLKWLKNNFKL